MNERAIASDAELSPIEGAVPRRDSRPTDTADVMSSSIVGVGSHGDLMGGETGSSSGAGGAAEEDDACPLWSLGGLPAGTGGGGLCLISLSSRSSSSVTFGGFGIPGSGAPGGSQSGICATFLRRLTWTDCSSGVISTLSRICLA